MNRGAVTEDGCPVELYRLLPPLGEAELIDVCIPPNSRVLDLGCGVGRIAHQLARLGHRVVGVDESVDMLDHATGIETARSTIADLELDERFDAVVLASHLLNSSEPGYRAAFLATAARHLAPGGVLVAEWHPPEWFGQVSDSVERRVGLVDVRLADVSRSDDLLSATVHYRAGIERWTQPFTCRQVEEATLRRSLTDAGLTFLRYLDSERAWFTAQCEDPTRMFPGGALRNV